MIIHGPMEIRNIKLPKLSKEDIEDGYIRIVLKTNPVEDGKEIYLIPCILFGTAGLNTLGILVPEGMYLVVSIVIERGCDVRVS